MSWGLTFTYEFSGLFGAEPKLNSFEFYGNNIPRSPLLCDVGPALGVFVSFSKSKNRRRFFTSSQDYASESYRIFCRAQIGAGKLYSGACGQDAVSNRGRDYVRCQSPGVALFFEYDSGSPVKTCWYGHFFTFPS